MKIVLLGATGATGTELLKQALDAGDRVTAVARTPSKITTKHKNLIVIKGDATDVKVLSKAMSGNEILVSALGTPIGPKANGKLITDSTNAIIMAAEEAGLKRVIMMSSFIVNRSQLTVTTKVITRLLMKKHAIDKAAGETKLRNSGMAWTIVYPTVLTNNEKTTKVRIMSSSERVSMSHKIARADVADWMLTEAREARHVKQAVTITG
jgi:putative NADH-flavin reductase